MPRISRLVLATARRLLPLRAQRYLIPALHYFRRKIAVHRVSRGREQALARVRKSRPKRVVFLVLHDAVWKYERLYRLMEESEHFEPIVVICPCTAFSDEVMKRDMKRSSEYFVSTGHRVEVAFSGDRAVHSGVIRELDPDIVFFTNPHKITTDECYITSFSDRFTCYSQYSFHVSGLNEQQYNQLFHHVLSRAYYETEIHRRMAIEHCSAAHENVHITGYPGVDDLLFPVEEVTDVWMSPKGAKKRIIWAPHHTILDDEPLLGWSCFLDYADFMLEFLAEREASLEMCFKPHPMLRAKLDGIWGEPRTTAYYAAWADLQNGWVEESGYIDLFLTSDALIHDSGSFMAEYMCVDKPAMFTIKNAEVVNSFNEFGDMVFALHYQGTTAADIEEFIVDVVIGGKDTLAENRGKFVSSTLFPPNEISASRAILNDLEAVARQSP